jgi:hypothetical protein
MQLTKNLNHTYFNYPRIFGFFLEIYIEIEVFSLHVCVCVCVWGAGPMCACTCMHVVFKTEFYMNLFQALMFIYCIYIFFEEWI